MCIIIDLDVMAYEGVKKNSHLALDNSRPSFAEFSNARFETHAQRE